MIDIDRAAAIGIAVGKIIDHYKMAKHFDITITDTDLVIERRSQPIDDEAALDGIYVVRTNVKVELFDSSSVVGAYKGLSNVDLLQLEEQVRRPGRLRSEAAEAA